MISLKVIKSPDKLKENEHFFHFDSITIGSKKKCDIYLKDKDIGKGILSVTVYENVATVKSEGLNSFFFLNGKKVSGEKVLKEGDLIRIGESQVQFIKGAKSWIDDSSTYSEDLNKALEKFPDLQGVVDLLEKEMILNDKQ